MCFRSQLVLQQQQQQLSASQITHQRRPLTSSTSYTSSSSLAARSIHTSSSTSIAYHQPVQPINEQTTQLLAIAKQDIGNLREKRKGKSKVSLVKYYP